MNVLGTTGSLMSWGKKATTSYFQTWTVGINASGSGEETRYVSLADNGVGYVMYIPAGGSTTQVQKTTNYGATWAVTIASAGSGTNAIACLKSTGANAIVAHPGPDYCEYTLNTGSTWADNSNGTVSNKRWQLVAMNTNATKLVGTTNGDGNFYISDGLVNGTWAISNLGLGTTMGNAICVNNSGIGLCALNTSTYLYRTTDGGANWSTLTGFMTATFSGVAISDSTYAYCCISSGSIYRSTDSGATFTVVSGTSGYTWNKMVCSTSGQIVVAVTSTTYAYYSTDYGQTWSATSSPSVGWYSVDMTSDGTKLLVSTFDRKKLYYVS